MEKPVLQGQVVEHITFGIVQLEKQRNQEPKVSLQMYLQNRNCDYDEVQELWGTLGE